VGWDVAGRPASTCSSWPLAWLATPPGPWVSRRRLAHPTRCHYRPCWQDCTRERLLELAQPGDAPLLAQRVVDCRDLRAVLSAEAAAGLCKVLVHGGGLAAMQVGRPRASLALWILGDDCLL
jgi:hypothetical protein